MPNDLDIFSFFVRVTLDSDLNVSPNDITVDSGAVATFAFMFKLGRPPATGFSDAWFTDATRVTQLSGSGPSNPIFTPASPGALQAAVDNPNSFHSGQLQVTAPTQQQTEDPVLPVVYYGKVTIHQA